MNSIRTAIACMAIPVMFSACAAFTGESEPTLPREGRAIWVVRSHYKTPDDVRAIMRNCAECGFNQVLFQVRGNATVFYRSKIEPWAWELTGGGPENLGKDPGWDPLAVAVEEAHKLGLELHAWVNVYPGWQGREWPAAGAAQLHNTHPDWFMKWKDGSDMLPYYMSKDKKVVWYSFINPAHPDVNPYLVSVFSEIVRNYAVDGIHMDYVRYPHDLKGWDFSYDPISLSRFAAENDGKTPDADPQAWNRWRAAQVTDLVRRLHRELKAIRPRVALTAAVAGNYEHGLGNMQDSRAWAAEHIIDGLILMNYQPDNEKYAANIRETVAGLKAAAGDSGACPIYSGMGPYKYAKEEGAAEKFKRQIEIAREEGAAGVAQFSYTTLFGDDHKPRPFAIQLRDEIWRDRAASPLAR